MKLPPLAGARLAMKGLANAGRSMAKYQPGRRLTEQEDEPIVEFPTTLAGELNRRRL
jgi:hypothetical protein